LPKLRHDETASMSNSGNHYELAFQDFLRQNGVTYVAIDQAKRACLASVRLKSFDFIVYMPGSVNLLVDVKGRKCSGRSFSRGGFGESWTTAEDVADLQSWQRVFGAGYLAVFVFGYWLFDLEASAVRPGVHRYGGRDYAFVTVALEEYLAHMRQRSASWRTFYLPARYMAQSARPLLGFLRAADRMDPAYPNQRPEAAPASLCQAEQARQGVMLQTPPI